LINIGENIKKIRQWKGIPQKTISDLTGIPQGTLSKIEGGSDILWSKLVGISAALEISIQDIVCFDANKVTFNLSGEKAKGVVINHNNQNEKQLQELIQVLKDENSFLRKMLEKSINKKQSNKR
jgi:transcriptional regulator with XRE-family HTH domain